MTTNNDDPTTQTVDKQSNEAPIAVPDTKKKRGRPKGLPPSGGAPPGNKNALKTGLHSSKLPEGCEYIGKQAIAFRNAAEAAVLESGGRIGVYEACVIETACEWVMFGLKLKRVLMFFADTLTPDQQFQYGKEAAKAFAERDRALKMLGLDKRDDDAHHTLYAIPEPEPEGQTNAPPEEAAD